MLKLKVKHKLLLIWLGSVFLTLAMMAALFNYQIAGLHQKDAQAAIANAINTLHQKLELNAKRLEQSTQTLSNRADLIASMNMIGQYQDPENYQARVFDLEKRKLAQELAEHATATDADILALYDSKNVLAAFYLSPAAGGNGAGYVSFTNGEPVPYIKSAKGNFQASDAAYLSAIIRQVAPLNSMRSQRTSISHRHADNLILSAAKGLDRTHTTGRVEPVGTIVAALVLGKKLIRSVSRETRMDLQALHPGETNQLASLNALSDQIALNDIPELVLDGNPARDHNNAHAWMSTENTYLGAVSMAMSDGYRVYFIFTQKKGALLSTLKAFQSTMLWVLLISGLAIIPVGLFFLHRFITRPVENLVLCADTLRQGEHQDMGVFTGSDEFSELARSFQVMSSAVRAREEALTESQKSLKNAQRIARTGNWEWDQTTDAMRYSDELYTILKRRPAQLSNSFDALLACVHPDDARTLRHRISAAIESGDEFQMEHRLILPDGDECIVLHHGEILRDENENAHINATVQDITERHLLERTKNNLVSNVSHELRSPLTSIVGTLGLAVGGAFGQLPERLQTMLKTADINAKRLGLLIDDLLDIEQTAGGSPTLDLHALSVSEMLNKAIATNKAHADAFDVTFKVEDPVDNLYVIADPGRMARVMANLLSNAAKFSENCDTVTISAVRTGERVAVSVSDKGPGIPNAFRQHVFERFAQADASLTRRDQKGGTGLGLAITKSIIEMHNGEISFSSVCSPSPNHGTTFTFTLPRWDEAQDRPTTLS